MVLVQFKRLKCNECKKVRWHESLLEIAKCVLCDTTRQDGEHEALEPRYIG